MKNGIRYFILGLAGLLLLYLSSCESQRADVPAYIQVDSVKVSTNSSLEGTNKQNITDVWFNLDGSRVGAFEIPACFPVIAEGVYPVSISAGILKSGIHDFREIYPFFKVVRDTLKFVANQIIPLTPVFEYKDETQFWIENFEDPGLKLYTNDSTNYLVQVVDPDNSENHVGLVYLPDTVDAFQVFTKIDMTLAPTPVYMEIEYKSDEAFGIGIIIKQMGGGTENIRPFTIVKASDKWNKLYLNLAEQFALSSGAVSYDVYFFFTSDVGVETHTYLDNIKILSF